MDLIKVLRQQAEIYIDLLSNKLETAKTQTDVFLHHSTAFKDFYSRAFKPMTDNKTIKDLDSAKMNELMERIRGDVYIAHEQLDNISTRISESYNGNQDYQTGLRNRIEYLSSIASDVSLMLTENDDSSIVFKDSLSNYNFVDKTFSNGTQANIATAEGIAFLAVAEDENISKTASAIKISGNGESGNYHIINKVDIQTFDEQYNIYSKYKSDEDAHDNGNSIIDGEASTWFEYQKLGVNDKTSTFYGITWAGADKISDNLILRINLELSKSSYINWIDITPYIPEKCKSNIVLYSVKVSEDGSNYTSVYKSMEIINKEINLIPQRYSTENVFEQDSLSKFISQGVLSFPSVKGKYIEVILKQTKPYDELLGQIYYNKITMSGKEEISRTLIGEQYVPPAIVASPIGKYKIDSTHYIVKNMAVMDGWRYVVGIRGIDVYYRKFEQQSEIITNKFETTKPINKIMLYTNEIIPDEFIALGLEKRNDWIKYYISINDSDWYSISPMHHNQIGALAIAPKIYEINSIASNEERNSSINKGYLTSATDVTSVRLKIVFSRPENLNTMTPILEEYALRCVVEGGTE